MSERRESTCGNCAFFQPNDWAEDTGTCHRAPPQSDGFSPVDEDDWCGEWYGGEIDVEIVPEELN